MQGKDHLVKKLTVLSKTALVQISNHLKGAKSIDFIKTEIRMIKNNNAKYKNLNSSTIICHNRLTAQKDNTTVGLICRRVRHYKKYLNFFNVNTEDTQRYQVAAIIMLPLHYITPIFCRQGLILIQSHHSVAKDRDVPNI